jgi:arylformamidase
MPSPTPANYADPTWCERQYNPRLLVPHAADIYARWPQESARVRAELPHDANIAYGPHPREIMDVFHANGARGALIFIHGGYWRMFSKDEFSYIAEGPVKAGITVAMLSYPLCPEVTVDDIAASIRRAVTKLWRDHLSPPERSNLVIAGHSAGGYLTAAMFATDWTEHALPATPFAGGLSISGVFELEPLVNTTMNELIRFNVDQARAWSLGAACPHVAAPLALVVGEHESPEFHRQSADLAAVWPEVCRKPASIPGRNHFDVVGELARAGTPVFETAMGLLGGVHG